MANQKPLLTQDQIQKAWTDREYFNSLTPQQQAYATTGGYRYTTENVQKVQQAAANDFAPSEFLADTTRGSKIVVTPKVNNASSGTASLRYPKDITNKDTDYVLFQFFDYVPPFGKGEGQDGLTNLDGRNAYRFYNASGVVKENQKPAEGFSPIILYMPEDIQAQYGARWGGADFATGAVGGMRTLGGKLPSADVAISAGAGMAKSKIYETILGELNKYTGSSINLDQFMGAVSGTILNPNTEMLYEGSQLRTFSLSFKMTPKDNTEAGKIKAICNTFKKAMLPNIGGQAFGGLTKAVSLLKVPKLCQVTYMNGKGIHPYLPVYKLCAIAGVDVNYTPDGSYSTYQGGSPVSTRLTVNFKETKLLFADDIEIDQSSPSY